MVTEAKTYNGWTNYETWAVALWMDNDEGSYNYWRETATEICREAEATTYSTEREEAVRELADRLKDEHEDGLDLLLESHGLERGSLGVFCDLLNAAMSEVDWHEIAKHLIDDNDES